MKRIFALVLALVMAMSLVACGKDANVNDQDADPNTGVGETVNTETPVVDETETPVEGEEVTDETETPVEGEEVTDETEQPVEGEEVTDETEPVEGEEATEDTEAEVDTENTIGKALMAQFIEQAGTVSAEELANALITNEAILFSGAAAPVEPGYLAGFDVEINGFKTATMFAPMIGTIPFVGYVFEMEDGADVAAFEQNLKDNANLRWNICTAADEMLVTSVGNTVFFLMAPYQLEA